MGEPIVYWRCEHNPSAIDNFFDNRKACEWDCHAQELKWYHGGMHPQPKSWGGVTRSNRFVGV